MDEFKVCPGQYGDGLPGTATSEAMTIQSSTLRYLKSHEQEKWGFLPIVLHNECKMGEVKVCLRAYGDGLPCSECG
jgi:hypothetical protein